MRAAMKDGVACIVDAGHPDMGRDLQFLKHLSARSGMPIVAGVGSTRSRFTHPRSHDGARTKLPTSSFAKHGHSQSERLVRSVRGTS